MLVFLFRDVGIHRKSIHDIAADYREHVLYAFVLQE